MEKSLKFMKVSSIAMMLVGAAAFTVVPMSWDAAQAKNNNGNGDGNGGVHVNNGKGGGNGNRKPRADGTGGSETRGGGNGNQAAHGNGGGNGNQATHGGGNGRGKPEHRRPTAPSSITITSDTSEEDVDIPRNHGAVASELGWRNAAHASETARANAAPNSAVGRVAAYRDAVEGTNGLEADVAAAEDELGRLEGLTDDEIDEEFPDGGYNDAVTAATDTLAEAEVALEDAPTAEEALGLIDGHDLSEEAIAALHEMLDI